METYTLQEPPFNHYVKESKDENRIRIEKIDGTKNPADGLTKPYDNYKFVQFRNLICPYRLVSVEARDICRYRQSQG